MINKIKEKIKILQKMPRRMAEKSFLLFIILFISTLLIGSTILYFNVFAPKIVDEIIRDEDILSLDMEAQQRVLEEWKKRNKNFQVADSKEYPNPFNIDQ